MYAQPERDARQRGKAWKRERERLMKGVRNVTEVSPYEMKHAI